MEEGRWKMEAKTERGKRWGIPGVDGRGKREDGSNYEEVMPG
jgi:hypothetical protein